MENPEMSMTVTPARPAVPLAAWIGGKRRLAPIIVDRLRAIPHQAYMEVFTGMGGVFLRRPWQSPVEVINDRSDDVANLFRVVQRHLDALIDYFRLQLASRAEFERLAAVSPETLTDIERAARFLYLQRLAFGGKVLSRAFGVDPTSPARLNPEALPGLLRRVHDRLSGVTIECLDWRDFLARYDRAGALMYLDPPYFGSEGYYGRALFHPADHAELAGRLQGLQANWLLSINDTPEIRALYGLCHQEPVNLRYSVSGGEGVEAAELLISREPIMVSQGALFR
jgi:DNA adenine methylase